MYMLIFNVLIVSNVTMLNWKRDFLSMVQRKVLVYLHMIPWSYQDQQNA